MRTQWLGLALACMTGVVHAETLTIPGANSARTETRTEPRTEQLVEPALGVLDVTDLRSLTNDPVLGKADRVHGYEAKGMVTFTFDDGPNPDTTPAVIDALEKYDVPATFFIVTRRLEGKLGVRPREILARMLEVGFDLGSHTVSHPNLRSASVKTLDNEIDTSLRTLAPAANRPIGLFRPPFGAFGVAGRKRLEQLGLTDVRWSVDTLDWKARDAQKLRATTVSMIVKQNGGVVLMHDVKPITAQVIAGILDDLEAENCRRLAAKQEPILPVSIHYFLKVGKTARPVPEQVERRTAAYRAALPKRCAARPPPAAPAGIAPAAAEIGPGATPSAAPVKPANRL